VKKITKKSNTLHASDELSPEYDFRGAVRGRHYKPLHQGYSIEVHQADGTTVVQNYKLDEGTVMLEPDVRAWFPDSEAVNKALRSLITLMEQMPDKGNPTKTQKSIQTPA